MTAEEMLRKIINLESNYFKRRNKACEEKDYISEDMWFWYAMGVAETKHIVEKYVEELNE